MNYSLWLHSVFIIFQFTTLKIFFYLLLQIYFQIYGENLRFQFKNVKGESGPAWFVPDFRGNAFNFSPLRIMLSVGLLKMIFIMLRYVPSMPALWRTFIINGCWILSKAFSASIEIIIWFLSFNLLMWCITLIDFVNIEESLHPWDKAHLVMMYDLYNMLLESVC